MKKILTVLFVSVLFVHSALFALTPDPGESIWSILYSVGQTIDSSSGSGVECDTRTQISDPGDGGTHVIDTAGNYVVIQDFANAGISIEANNVDLDLNGREIVRNATSGQSIIEVDSSCKNVSIHDGYVRDSSGSNNAYGVALTNSNSNIQLKNVAAFECARGFSLDGILGSEIDSCKVIDCTLAENTAGMYIDAVNNSFFANCRVIRSTRYGFDISSGNYNYFLNCHVLDLNSTLNHCSGFRLESGKGVLFRRCVVKNILQSSPAVGARGFTFYNYATFDIKIIDCLVSGIEASSWAYGIHVPDGPEGCILKNNTLVNCGHGFSADSGVFVVDNNAAIQNLSFNNGSSETDNYEQVNNIDYYDVLGTDNVERMDNIWVTWGTP